MSDKMTSLNDLYIDELRDLYSAETQLLQALPKVIEKVTNNDLRKALQTHLEETKWQQETISEMIKGHDAQPGGEKCEAMAGLVKEADEMMQKPMTAEVMDAAMIACCQRVEHYEIAGYGTVRAYAQALGHKDDYKKLSEIFEQEEAADEKLTDIAVTSVNEAAGLTKV